MRAIMILLLAQTKSQTAEDIQCRIARAVAESDDRSLESPVQMWSRYERY